MALPGERTPHDPAEGRHANGVVTPLGAPPHAPEQPTNSLAFYLEAVSEGRWIVLGSLLVAMLGLAWVLGTAVPLWEADVLLQIEDPPQNNPMGMMNLEGALVGPKGRVSTEIEVMQSRKLLGAVVDALHLDVTAHPRYWTRIGRAIAQRRDGDEPASAILGATRYAWGGERIQVPRFDVPPELEDSTIDVALFAAGPGHFRILDRTGKFLAEGEVGKPITWNVPVPGGEAAVTLFVKELRARPGTEFVVRKTSRALAAKWLASQLRYGEKGKFTGVIRVSMSSPSPSFAVSVLNSFAQNYLRQNVEKRSDEAERTLQFLDAQIPLLRANVEAAEAALEQYKVKEGTAGVDLTLATTATLERSADLEKRLAEIELQRKEMLYRFTPNHPAIRSLDEKVAFLRAEARGINDQIAALPEAESMALRLKRDVTVASGLYLALLNRAQELKITKSGLIGNVRILDLAVMPEAPLDPKRGQKAAIAIFLGLAVGVGLAVARKALHQGLRDPAEAERLTGLPVRASIPHSERQAGLEKERKSRRDERHPVLAAVDPTDMAAESLRSLRTSLQFALMDAPNQVIAVGGPRPGVGKSFVTVNLARVFADAGKSVLLLDADLRKGSLHGYLGVHRTPGLAEAIAGTVSIADVLHRTDLPGIDFVPRGSSPSNPSELLGSERFREMVAGLSKGYDLVLIDLPPVLAVTDAALVGRVAGVNLLVLRSGWHPIREVQLAVKAYAENGVRLSGLVFNDVPQGKGGPGGYAYQYQYHYQYSYKPRDEK